MTAPRFANVIFAVMVLFSTVGNMQLAWAQGIPVTKYRALVIGNSAYLPDRLSGPDNDANDIAAVFGEIGFTVVNAALMTNLSRSQMEGVIEGFMQEVDRNTVAIVYYSGHGVEDDNKNYLVPVDAALKNYADIEKQLISLDAILKRFAQREARTRVVILDACRDLPLALKYTKSFDAKGGLAAVKELGPGTSIVYATSPNRVAIAATQSQRNSVFTSALLSAIKQKPPTFLDLLVTAAKSTYEMTGMKQSPWLSGELQMAAFQLHGAGQHSPLNPLTQLPAEQPRSAANTRPELIPLGCNEISEQITKNGVVTWRKRCT